MKYEDIEESRLNSIWKPFILQMFKLMDDIDIDDYWQFITGSAGYLILSLVSFSIKDRATMDDNGKPNFKGNTLKYAIDISKDVTDGIKELLK